MSMILNKKKGVMMMEIASAHAPYQARQLYADGMNIKQIAEAMNVTSRTVSDWKAKMGDWEKLRIVQANGDVENYARILLKKIVYHFERYLDVVDDLPLDDLEKLKLFSEMSESFARAVNANKKLMPEVDKYAVKLEVLAELAGMIQKNAPHLAEQFAEYVALYEG